MDHNPQLVGGSFRSASSATSSRRSTTDGYEAVSTTSAIGSGAVPGGALFWSPAIQPTAFWEVVLIAILFLSISGLVGFRLVELLTDRDVTVPNLSLPVGTSGSDANASTDSARYYERVISPETPPELLSDEGQVVRLLVANGGQIRQHRIVEETGWSKSKVSRTLSRMNEDGTIEKVSLGRENVVRFADEGSDEARRAVDADRPAP